MITPAVAGNQAALTGRVIQVSPLRTEPLDFSWWRLLWKGILWTTLGAAAVVYLVVSAIVRFGFPRACGRSPWTWLLLLRGNTPATAQLVQFFVHGDDGGERMAEVKGRKLRGAVQPGHRVVLWGGWRGGVLRVDYGFNTSTQSWFGAA